MAKKKNQSTKKRNIVVLNMITRSQKAGSFVDKKKRDSRRACRGRIVTE